MPELPEVETITRYLQRKLTSKKILEVITHNPESNPRISCDPKTLLNASFHSIFRRGKYLLWIFENQECLLIHLGMTGSFLLSSDESLISPYDRISFLLSSNEWLRFRDPRKFGKIQQFYLPSLTQIPSPLLSLGVEPLSPDFSVDYLKNLCHQHSCTIKILLMNQRVIAGLGNIYVNEALFRAHIHPMRLASSLSLEEIVSLHNQIQQVLQEAIEQEGTTLKDYTKLDGSHGFFTHYLQIYGREKEPCLLCQTPIIRIKQNGRSSYFCPLCQPFP